MTERAVADEATDVIDRAAPAATGRQVVVEPQPAAPLRRLALVTLVATIACVAAVRAIAWDEPRPPSGVVEHALALLSISWALPILPVALTIAGYALFRRRPPVTVEIPCVPEPGPLVAFRIVTRGQNVAAVTATVASVRATMAELPLFPHVIEVVSDIPLPLAPADDLVQLVVPGDFRTPSGTRYKARALAYALDVSDLADGDWILHLDEESHVTPSLIVGLRDAIAEEELRERPRIGQGLIVYSRSLRDNTFFALADSIRSGDDIGRFHAQARLGITLVGLHGSFVLARTDVERGIGFDFGPRGSITEDAWWALLAMDQGIRSRWVEGVVIEQSPQTVGDFLRQRRRWFTGLTQVARHTPVGLRWRSPLAVSVGLWAIAWASVVWTLMNLWFGLRTPPGVAQVGTLVVGVYMAQYIVGLRLNLDALEPAERPGPWARAGLYAAQVALVPVFAVLEGAAVIWGIGRPSLGFHVIRKD